MRYFLLIALFLIPIFPVSAAWTVHEDTPGHLQYYKNGDGNYVFRWDDNRTGDDQYLYYRNGPEFYGQDAIDNAYADDDSQLPAASTASPVDYSLDWPCGWFYPFSAHYADPSACSGGGGGATSTSATSTEALLGSIAFGQAILICLVFLMVVGFMWNNMTLKKPWL